MAPPPAAAAPAAPAPAAAPAPPAKTWKDLLTVEGLVDAYYQYNFTGTNSLVGPTGGRNFDLNSNAFTLNYAKVGLGVAPEPVGLRIDLGYGATGAIINAANPLDHSAEAFLIQQAYATIAPGGAPGLTVDFGKFVTTAGAEVIEANKNWAYSRSLLFFNIPLVHTGLRLTYAASKELILQASVVNGWNGVGFAPDVSKDKTYGLSINYTVPGVGTNIIATGYFGKGEQYADAATMTELPSPDTRVVGDLVVAQTVGALGLNLNVDYVNDKTAGFDNLIGAAAMGHYTVNDNLALTLRLEYLKNGSAKTFEGTATAAIPVGGRYEFRLELREDHASAPTYDIGAQDKDQFTGTGAFLAWF